MLTDDERGRILYVPRFVDRATADAWFAALRDEVKWRVLRRKMYEREVDVPRLIGHYRLDSAPGAVPATIADASRRVADRLGAPFNSVGLNRYRDGRDSVAPHNDHLDEGRISDRAWPDTSLASAVTAVEELGSFLAAGLCSVPP